MFTVTFRDHIPVLIWLFSLTIQKAFSPVILFLFSGTCKNINISSCLFILPCESESESFILPFEALDLNKS